jgi:FixJ family two-component response regulator
VQEPARRETDYTFELFSASPQKPTKPTVFEPLSSSRLSKNAQSMNLSVFDTDVEAQSHWKRLATHNNLNFEGFSDLIKLQENALSNTPQLIVIDVELFRGDFINEVEGLCRNYRQHLFVVTAKSISVQLAVQLMHFRVAWVFLKPLSLKEVQTAMQTVVQLAGEVSSALDEFRDLEAKLSSITTREREVLDLILQSKVNKDSAKELNISIRTVETRRAKIYQKTGVEGIVGLVRMVERLEQLRRRFGQHKKDPMPHHHLGATQRDRQTVEN